MVGRPRRRGGLGARRPRHEGPRRRRRGRIRLPRAGGRTALRRRPARPDRGRGGGRRLRRIVARAGASGHGTGRFRDQRGWRRTLRLRRPGVLPLRGRREGDGTLQAPPARAERARIRSARRRQRPPQGGACARGARPPPAPRDAHPRGARVPRDGARRRAARREGARPGSRATPARGPARRAAAGRDALADDDRGVPQAERDPGHVRRRGGLSAAPRPGPGRGRGAAPRGGSRRLGDRVDPRRAGRRHPLPDGHTALEGAGTVGGRRRAGRSARTDRDSRVHRQPLRPHAAGRRDGLRFFPLVAMEPQLAAALIHSADERIAVDDLELGVDLFRHLATSDWS